MKSNIDDIDIKKLLKELEYNAFNYYGVGSTVYLICGNDIAKLEGYIYEPHYEHFSATHSISLNGEILFARNSVNVSAYYNETKTYGKFKTTEEAISFLQGYFKDKEIILQYDEPNIQNKDNEEEEEEEF